MIAQFSKETLTRVLGILKYIKENGPSIYEAGICANLEMFLLDDENLGTDIVVYYSKDWKHKVPDIIYFPVEGCDEKYHKASENYKLWSKTTKYGRLRWNLLNHMIKRVQEDLLTYSENFDFLKALYDIQKSPAPEYAICSNLYYRLSKKYTMEDCVDLVSKYSISWENYSGDPLFPIEGNMVDYLCQDNFWSKNSKYGKQRWKLLKHLIKELEKEAGLYEVLQ